MEFKWSIIAIMAMVVVMFGGSAIGQYQSGQCRIEAIKAQIDPSKIKEICR
jgi:hypothetical protein